MGYCHNTFTTEGYFQDNTKYTGQGYISWDQISQVVKLSNTHPEKLRVNKNIKQ